jgi:hypothetical protein
MSLSISLGTRARPGMLARTVEATLPNITHKDTKLVICADDDDEGTLSLQDKLNDPRIIWSILPREDSLGEKFNRVLTAAQADVYLAMVDYGPMVTKGFDEKIIEAAQVYPDGYAVILNHLVCAVDPCQPNNNSFSQINAVTHKLAVKMGGMYPAIFPYWFVDHWLEDMATLIGRKVFVDIVANCTSRPGTMDRREPAFWGVVFDWLHIERNRLAAEIINLPDFDETAARKAALLRNMPFTNERSFSINSWLRELPPGDIQDERYLRIRQKAFELVQGIQAEFEKKKEAA